MRGALLIALLMAALALSGCLADRDGDGNLDGLTGQNDGNQVVGTDAQGNEVREGDDLGTISFNEEGNAGVRGYSTACDDPLDGTSTNNIGVVGGDGDHRWDMPRTSPDGLTWKAKSLTVEVVQDPRTTIDLDIFLYDHNSGQLLGRSFEEGPDGADGLNSITLLGHHPAPLRIVVVNCGGASVSYDVAANANMVASRSTGSGGPCAVEPSSNGYVASRQQSAQANLDGTAGTASISTGAGTVTYGTGAGTSYELVATFRARGDTQQQACERLAEMYLDHTATGGPGGNTLEAHGRPGGSGQWSGKQIDLEFTAPGSIDWTSFEVDVSAGNILVEGVTATALNLDVSAGNVDLSNSDADSLSMDASAGNLLVRSTKAGDMDLSASAGNIIASMEASTSSGAWDLDGSAGNIDLTVKETSSIGYDVDARTSAGTVSFSFRDADETSSDCRYAGCHRTARTDGYDSRSVKVTVDMDLSAGNILAGS